ncbi:MAG: hypothetical protein ABW173_03845 [Sphingomonas sp.]
MTAITTADLRRLALSSVGALVLSATCIAGAVVPARAAEPTSPNAPLTVADWQADVGGQLDAKLRTPKAELSGRDHLLARVDVAFDRDGNFTGAKIAQSSGSGSVDRQVILIAERIAYPPLPAGFRGRPQVVTLQAYFGQPSTAEAAARQEAAVQALANGGQAKHDAVQTAALPSG